MNTVLNSFFSSIVPSLPPATEVEIESGTRLFSKWGCNPATVRPMPRELKAPLATASHLRAEDAPRYAAWPLKLSAPEYTARPPELHAHKAQPVSARVTAPSYATWPPRYSASQSSGIEVATTLPAMAPRYTHWPPKLSASSRLCQAWSTEVAPPMYNGETFLPPSPRYSETGAPPDAGYVPQTPEESWTSTVADRKHTSVGVSASGGQAQVSGKARRSAEWESPPAFSLPLFNKNSKPWDDWDTSSSASSLSPLNVVTSTHRYWESPPASDLPNPEAVFGAPHMTRYITASVPLQCPRPRSHHFLPQFLVERMETAAWECVEDEVEGAPGGSPSSSDDSAYSYNMLEGSASSSDDEASQASTSQLHVELRSWVEEALGCLLGHGKNAEPALTRRIDICEHDGMVVPENEKASAVAVSAQRRRFFLSE